MANTLTAVAPVAYSAAKKVAAEPFGLLGAINLDFDDKGVAIGDTVYVPVAPTRATSDYTPAMTVTAGTDAVAASTAVTISANKNVTWNITGEQYQSLQNATADKTWFEQLMQQGMRALRNGMESAAWTAAMAGASRAFGTAATTPFASDLTALTAARKILQDNGAPLVDMSLIIDTNAGMNLRNLGVLQNAYQAGGPEERRTGRFLPQMGFAIRESAQVTTRTAGAMASATSTSAAFTVGQTVIPLATAGTGLISAGDVVTFANDSNKYVVASVSFAGANPASGDSITLQAPGLRVAQGVATRAITVVATFTGNIALERDAIVGVVRPPLIPANPTISQLLVSDDYGMTYLLVDAVGDGMRTMRLHLAYGFKTVNPEFSAIVLG